MTRRVPPLLALLALAAPLGACMVGPNYVRPPAPTPPAFKEGPEATAWRPAQALDGVPKGDWWRAFNDPVLNDLERRVAVNNQNVLAAEASYRQARALVAEARASLFPTATASGGVSRSGGGGGGSVGTTSALGGTTTAVAGGRDVTSWSADLGASWAPDLWGQIRRQVEANRAAAQASAADLANATLTAQAELAADYLSMRILDEEKRLYDEEEKAYAESYRITQNQYRAGVIAQTNVITAQAQLLSVQASDQAVGVQRAQYEHAIAVLTGSAPAELTLAPQPLIPAVPVAPAGLPAALLQRRPDIAAAERAMKQENALIGVQVAAYYPNITLSGSYGFSAANLGSLFKAGNDVWSLGANAAETLLDFGSRRARVRGARAAYDQAVAAYRQTVLTAFQQVEDELAALRILEGEQAVREEAARQARIAEQLTLNQYKAGTVDYTSVVSAQTIALNDALAVLETLQQRQVAAVTLIEDLGGGWSDAELPAKV